MKYKIRDLRNDPKAIEDRDAEELANDLVGYACYVDAHPREVGGVIKKLKRNGKDFSKLKSKHTKKDRMVGK